MKPLAKSYLMMALAAALTVTGCASGPTGEQAQTAASNRVIEAYNVPDLLAQAAPAVVESLENNVPDSVSQAERQRLRDAVYDVYAPEKLQAGVAERLRERAAEADRKPALASAADKLAAPLATRMIELESAAGSDDFAEGFRAFVDQPATEARKQRLRIIDGLADDMEVISLQTEFNVTLLRGMIKGRDAVVDPAQQASDSRVEQMVSNTREGIRDQLEQRVPLMLLYVYRDVDDATLQQYADLQAESDMTWTNQALRQAITDTLAAAGERIPEQMNAGTGA
ncbi:hypothetical protein SAOR_15170 [Salinisphaera orenii MK-B5]|uniref:DUF2059 domain-containing protein n=1 Tax=Salinisphaera orenii MK-B5 TaxID=856730 RepID=A0A423PFV3_9GAMM|nr:hypothetical protein [Salinisphaera orenii]ROO24529.1 hypothetical protein SAOR_15170 [Salinisphaera orenii MK-B5]